MYLTKTAKVSRSTEIVPGYRFIDRDQTNALANDFFDPSSSVRSFTNPTSGFVSTTFNGLDFADFDGFQNAAASMDGFNTTSASSLANLNSCVFPNDIDGDKLCAATNGLNREEFNQQGTQATITWDASDALTIKYIYGQNKLSYQRTTDDDNTYSQFHDRQFYVNHEADYSSHELQAFFEFSDTISVTSGVFWYDALIDQRGDFYSSVNEARMTDARTYSGDIVLGAVGTSAGVLNNANLLGVPVNAILGAVAGVNLFSAKDSCMVENPAANLCA